MTTTISVHVDDLEEQISEDPNRTAYEKETSIHMCGDEGRFEVTSFKSTVFTKLLSRSEFELKWLNILKSDGVESTVESLEAVKENPGLTVIGATGTLPVGSLSIGVPRRSDSHAQVVKT